MNSLRLKFKSQVCPRRADRHPEAVMTPLKSLHKTSGICKRFAMGSRAACLSFFAARSASMSETLKLQLST